jgi:hypothetical protein
LTVYVRRRRVVRRLPLFERWETVLPFAVVVLLVLDVAAGSSEESRVAFTTV